MCCCSAKVSWGLLLRPSPEAQIGIWVEIGEGAEFYPLPLSFVFLLLSERKEKWRLYRVVIIQGNSVPRFHLPPLSCHGSNACRFSSFTPKTTLVPFLMLQGLSLSFPWPPLSPVVVKRRKVLFSLCFLSLGFEYFY